MFFIYIFRIFSNWYSLNTPLPLVVLRAFNRHIAQFWLTVWTKTKNKQDLKSNESHMHTVSCKPCTQNNCISSLHSFFQTKITKSYCTCLFGLFIYKRKGVVSLRQTMDDFDFLNRFIEKQAQIRNTKMISMKSKQSYHWWFIKRHKNKRLIIIMWNVKLKNGLKVKSDYYYYIQMVGFGTCTVWTVAFYSVIVCIFAAGRTS